MSNSVQKSLGAAALGILRQLARVMLNHGIAYGVFAELTKKAFVEEGFDYLQKSGQRPTTSGISALTGLTRKETKRLRESDDNAELDPGHRYSRAIRIISGWVNDPRFHDEHGNPATLPLEGDEGSFSLLVKEYSGDIPVVAMLSLLEKSQNIRQQDSGVELIERAYIPMNTPVDKIQILGTDVAELIGTINHNLEAAPEHRLFQRKVSNTLIRSDAIPEFRQFSNQKSQQLLEEYHQWLSAHEVETGEVPRSAKGYVAVGIYYVEHSTGEGNP